MRRKVALAASSGTYQTGTPQPDSYCQSSTVPNRVQKSIFSTHLSDRVYPNAAAACSDLVACPVPEGQKPCHHNCKKRECRIAGDDGGQWQCVREAASAVTSVPMLPVAPTTRMVPG